jgi:hypothetical protein
MATYRNGGVGTLRTRTPDANRETINMRGKGMVDALGLEPRTR